LLEALDLYYDVGDVAGVGFALGDIALLSAGREGAERAAELFGAVNTHLARVGRVPCSVSAEDTVEAMVVLQTRDGGRAPFHGRVRPRGPFTVGWRGSSSGGRRRSGW
jgi:hypothetical protein